MLSLSATIRIPCCTETFNFVNICSTALTLQMFFFSNGSIDIKDKRHHLYIKLRKNVIPVLQNNILCEN